MGKIKGEGDVVTGRVEQGKITPGVNVKFYPTGCTGNIFSIEMHHKNVDTAHCGDNLAEVSKNMPWYKGFEVKVKKEKVKGHTLVDALEKVVRPPKRNDKKAFRMP